MKMERFRPRLEVLEDRLVPATLDWTGATSSDWSDNTNWKVGSSVATQAPTLNDEARIGVAGVTISRDPQVGTSVTHQHYSVSKLESGTNWTGTLLIYGSIACVNNDNTLDSSSNNTGLGFWKSGKIDFGQSSYLALDPANGTDTGPNGTDSSKRRFSVYGGTLGSSNSPYLGNIYVGAGDDNGASLKFFCTGETLGAKLWDGYTGDGTTVVGTKGWVYVGSSGSTDNLHVIQNAIIYTYGDQVALDWTMYGVAKAGVLYGELDITGVTTYGSGTVGGIDATDSTGSTIENKGYTYCSIGGFSYTGGSYVIIKDPVDNYQTFDFAAGRVYLQGSIVNSSGYDFTDMSTSYTPVVRITNAAWMNLYASWNNSASTLYSYGGYSAGNYSLITSINSLSLNSGNIYDTNWLQLQSLGTNTNVSMSSIGIYVTMHWDGSGWNGGKIIMDSNGVNCTFSNTSITLDDEGQTGGVSTSREILYVNSFSATGTQPTFTSKVGNGHTWGNTATNAGGILTFTASW
jgi:hypothetical protein